MENTRIHIPLLDGEYHPPLKIRSRAQILFLDTVARVSPAPLYSLRNEILPKFRAAFAAEKKRQRPNAEIGKLSNRAVVDLLYVSALTKVEVPQDVRVAMKAHPLFYKAAAALIDWSKNFNLIGKRCDPPSRDDTDGPASALQHRCWPIVAALKTILFWQFHGIGWIWERRDPPGWCPPVLMLHDPPPELEALPPIELLVTIQPPDGKGSREIPVVGWDVGLERETQFRQRVGEAFERWMDKYVAGRKQSAQVAGLEEPPGKRNLTLQFTWLARYQIDKLSPARLASEYKVKKAAVEDGIDAASDLIDLEKRPPERGGRKGTTHSKPKR